MLLAIGEILFDYFPEYRRMGGAPFNFAFHLKSLGYDVRFISRVGMDEAGAMIRNVLTTHGFDDHDLQTDRERPTGAVDIVLDEKGVPDFTIRKNAAYDRLVLSDRIHAYLSTVPEMIYFGTLIQRTGRGFETVQDILNARPPGTRTLYDVNLRHDCYTPDIVLRSLGQADIVKLNADELSEVSDMAGAGGNEQQIAFSLMKQFTIDVLCVTDGSRGSRIYKGGSSYAGNVLKNIQIADTVGAGDAFAAVLAIGCIKGWDPDTILDTAGRFAGDICGIKGAVPEDPEFYVPYHEILGKEINDR